MTTRLKAFAKVPGRRSVGGPVTLNYSSDGAIGLMVLTMIVQIAPALVGIDPILDRIATIACAFAAAVLGVLGYATRLYVTDLLTRTAARDPNAGAALARHAICQAGTANPGVLDDLLDTVLATHRTTTHGTVTPGAVTPGAVTPGAVTPGAVTGTPHVGASDSLLSGRR